MSQVPTLKSEDYIPVAFGTIGVLLGADWLGRIPVVHATFGILIVTHQTEFQPSSLAPVPFLVYKYL